jgi:hypothetical protein
MTRASAAGLVCGAALALTTTACDSAGVRAAKDADRRAAMVEMNGGTTADQCAARKAAADAWLNALDTPNYQRAKTAADLVCNRARLESLAL